MTFVAYPDKDWKLFDYILGNLEMSIATDRYYYLYDINRKNTIKIALMDRETKFWTKWDPFPGSLVNYGQLEMAIDVHRSILDNEIIIESDYPKYEDNYEAAKIIGSILEKNGFTPLYYYSGNKSIHIHVFIDWTPFFQIEDRKEFMLWLRTKMINCWDTNVRQFDTDLINANHLIRCELSKNKRGYKTFLGYSHKDMSFVPYVCNEENRVYPQLGKIKLSCPNNPQVLIEDFLKYKKKKDKEKKIRDNNISTMPKYDNSKMRKCVELILNDDFKKYGDGFSRGSFILISELRRIMDEGKALEIAKDWNIRMGSPLKDRDIEYRFKRKVYTFSSASIEKFLGGLGIKGNDKV